MKSARLSKLMQFYGPAGKKLKRRDKSFSCQKNFFFTSRSFAFSLLNLIAKCFASIFFVSYAPPLFRLFIAKTVILYEAAAPFSQYHLTVTLANKQVMIDGTDRTMR